jgi:hypothetical protein
VLPVEDLVEVYPAITDLDGNEVDGQGRAGENQEDNGQSEHVDIQVGKAKGCCLTVVAERMLKWNRGH